MKRVIKLLLCQYYFQKASNLERSNFGVNLKIKRVSSLNFNQDSSFAVLILEILDFEANIMMKKVTPLFHNHSCCKKDLNLEISNFEANSMKKKVKQLPIN